MGTSKYRVHYELGDEYAHLDFIADTEEEAYEKFASLPTWQTTTLPYVLDIEELTDARNVRL